MNMKYYERDRGEKRVGIMLLVDRWSGKRIDGGGPPLREKTKQGQGWLVFLSLTLLLSFSIHFSSLTR